jgi:NAD(P)-dependent dehydrogenase (short-subunit alcohol dehydrogenase family)
VELDGRVVVVTAANTGIGKETARSLAAKGAGTILACRDPVKAEAAVADIRASTGNDDVSSVRVDLSDLHDVEQCAVALHDRYGRVDVLVNNAGGVWTARQVTPQGYEYTFTVNYLSHYLLTRLLLPSLLAAAPSRVVNVTSIGHRFALGIKWGDLRYERRWNGGRAYNHSKLAQVLFTRELARRYGADGIGQDGDTNGLYALSVQAVMLASVTPAKGAETSVHLATSPVAAGSNGGYWARSKPHRPSRPARDDDAARRLWDVSEDLVTKAGVSL